MYQDLLFHLIGGSSQEDSQQAEEASTYGTESALVIPSNVLTPLITMQQPVVVAPVVVAPQRPNPVADVLVPPQPFVVEEPTCVVCTEDLISPAWTDNYYHRECCENCLQKILDGSILEGLEARCPICRAPCTQVLCRGVI